MWASIEAIETNSAGAARPHVAGRGRRHVVHRAQVGVEDVVPGVVVDLEDRLPRVDAGIVHQDVHPAEARDGLGEGGVGALAEPDVAVDGLRPGRAAEARGGVRESRLVDVDQTHSGPSGREELGDGEAEPLAPPVTRTACPAISSASVATGVPLRRGAWHQRPSVRLGRLRHSLLLSDKGAGASPSSTPVSPLHSGCRRNEGPRPSGAARGGDRRGCAEAARMSSLQLGTLEKAYRILASTTSIPRASRFRRSSSRPGSRRARSSAFCISLQAIGLLRKHDRYKRYSLSPRFISFAVSSWTAPNR